MKPYEYLLQNYGQREIAGIENNAWIVGLSTELGHFWVTSDEPAWCSEAVNWANKQAGLPITGSALARSFLTWGKETKNPKCGDIVVFQRPPNPREGHVGYFMRKDGDKIWCLGGNQSNMVNISDYHVIDVLSYREVPNTIPLQAHTSPIPTDNFPILRKGSRGDEVRLLQRRLGNLAIDGIFGSATEQKVKNYQISNGLTPDGIVGFRTRLKLNMI